MDWRDNLWSWRERQSFLVVYLVVIISGIGGEVVILVPRGVLGVLVMEEVWALVFVGRSCVVLAILSLASFITAQSLVECPRLCHGRHGTIFGPIWGLCLTQGLCWSYPLDLVAEGDFGCKGALTDYC